MKSIPKLGALTLAAMLVLSVVAPAALAASAAGNTAGNVSVATGGAEDVTNSSATLTGEVEGLDNESADVYFELSGNNSSETLDAGNLTEDGEFSAEATGLENNTTYTYVAYATVNGTTYSGEEATFTTGAESDDGNASDAFGMKVSSFVHDLLDSKNDTEGGIGQEVSEFVTANNPGADKRPDYAGPPEDRGKNASDDKRRGPPENKGPDGDQGPPEDKGPNATDDDDEAESSGTGTASD